MGIAEYWTIRAGDTTITIRRTPGGMFEWGFMGATHYHHGLSDTIYGAKHAARKAAGSQR